MRLPFFFLVCYFLCIPLIIFGPITRFYEIKFGGHAIESDRDTILFKSGFQPFIMMYAQTSEVEVKVIPLNVEPWHFVW
jgi:hypothetical protein